MLKLFSSRSDHPLANEDELRRIAAQIGAMEPRTAVAELNDWLDSLSQDSAIGLESRFGILVRFDDTVQTPVRKLVREIFALPQQVKEHPGSLIELGRELNRRLALGYMSCFELAEEGGSKDFAKNSLPRLIIRSLRAHGQWLKWSQYRYGPLDPVIWQNLGAAYLAAVEGRFDTRPCAAYGEGRAESSPEQEYLKALLFQTSAVDHLRPQEVEITERLIPHLLAGVRLVREVQPGATHWIDPGRPMAPMRIARLPEPSSGLRFLNMSRALTTLNELLATVEKGELPEGLDLGAAYPPKVVLPVLQHIATYWAPRPPTRAFPRHPVRTGARSVVGFTQVHGQLSGRETAAVSWQITDVSRGGFCVRVRLRDDGTLRLGALLAIQPEGGDNWLVGIIRRMARDAERRGRLGIETLSHAPVALAVELAGRRRDVLLLDPIEQGGLVRLALPQFGYEDAIGLQLDHDGRRAELEPAGLMESAEACDLARYRVVRLAAIPE